VVCGTIALPGLRRSLSGSRRPNEALLFEQQAIHMDYITVEPLKRAFQRVASCRGVTLPARHL